MSDEPQEPYQVSAEARRRANLTAAAIVTFIVLAVAIKFTTTALGW